LTILRLAKNEIEKIGAEYIHGIRTRCYPLHRLFLMNFAAKYCKSITFIVSLITKVKLTNNLPCYLIILSLSFAPFSVNFCPFFVFLFPYLLPCYLIILSLSFAL